MTKYYANRAGEYLGGFGMPVDKEGSEPDHPDLPAAAVEVPGPPQHAAQKWDGVKWTGSPATVEPRFAADASVIEAASNLAEVKAALSTLVRRL